MKDVLLQHLCNYVLRLLPNIPDLDAETRKELEEKVKTIAAQALDSETSLNSGLDHIAKRHIKFTLITRILNEVLKDSPEEVISKVSQGVLNAIQESPPSLFTGEADPSKEGRAKKYEKGQIEKKRGAVPLSFATIGDQELTQSLLVATFRDELTTRYQKEYKNIFEEGLRGINFLSRIFEEALAETSKKIVEEKIEPSRRIHKFFQCFFGKHRKTEYKEKITREIFKDLIGNRVAGGLGIKTPLDIHDPLIKKLINDYKTGTWKEGETREIVIPYISSTEDRNFRPVLDAIQQLPEFTSIMTRYFESL